MGTKRKELNKSSFRTLLTFGLFRLLTKISNFIFNFSLKLYLCNPEKGSQKSLVISPESYSDLRLQAQDF
ncbi:MAG: hypothetical protein JWQ63_4368 [Mucilaginibacter sp.]|nr:hypothetical protein [Mucilaginibacter sp.]